MPQWASVFKLQYDLNPYWLNLVLSLQRPSHDFESTLSYAACFSCTIAVSDTYGMLHRTGTIWLQSELERPWDSLQVSLACQHPKSRDADPTNASTAGDISSPSHNFPARHNTDIATCCYGNTPGFKCWLVMCYFLDNRQQHMCPSVSIFLYQYSFWHTWDFHVTINNA